MSLMTAKKSGRRSALLSDPLDNLTGATPPPAPTPRATKERLTVQLDAGLLDEVRNAVVYLSGPPVRLTVAGLVDAAVRAELERLREAHTKGRPFPKHDAPLRAGRPLGS